NGDRGFVCGLRMGRGEKCSDSERQCEFSREISVPGVHDSSPGYQIEAFPGYPSWEVGTRLSSMRWSPAFRRLHISQPAEAATPTPHKQGDMSTNVKIAKVYRNCCTPFSRKLDEAAVVRAEGRSTNRRPLDGTAALEITGKLCRFSAPSRW